MVTKISQQRGSSRTEHQSSSLSKLRLDAVGRRAWLHAYENLEDDGQKRDACEQRLAHLLSGSSRYFGHFDVAGQEDLVLVLAPQKSDHTDREVRTMVSRVLTLYQEQIMNLSEPVTIMQVLPGAGPDTPTIETWRPPTGQRLQGLAKWMGSKQWNTLPADCEEKAAKRDSMKTKKRVNGTNPLGANKGGPRTKLGPRKTSSKTAPRSKKSPACSEGTDIQRGQGSSLEKNCDQGKESESDISGNRLGVGYALRYLPNLNRSFRHDSAHQVYVIVDGEPVDGWSQLRTAILSHRQTHPKDRVSFLVYGVPDDKVLRGYRALAQIGGGDFHSFSVLDHKGDGHDGLDAVPIDMDSVADLIQGSQEEEVQMLLGQVDPDHPDSRVVNDGPGDWWTTSNVDIAAMTSTMPTTQQKERLKEDEDVQVAVTIVHPLALEEGKAQGQDAKKNPEAAPDNGALSNLTAQEAAKSVGKVSQVAKDTKSTTTTAEQMAGGAAAVALGYSSISLVHSMTTPKSGDVESFSPPKTATEAMGQVVLHGRRTLEHDMGPAADASFDGDALEGDTSPNAVATGLGQFVPADRRVWSAGHSKEGYEVLEDQDHDVDELVRCQSNGPASAAVPAMRKTYNPQFTRRDAAHCVVAQDLHDDSVLNTTMDRMAALMQNQLPYGLATTGTAADATTVQRSISPDLGPRGLQSVQSPVLGMATALFLNARPSLIAQNADDATANGTMTYGTVPLRSSLADDTNWQAMPRLPSFVIRDRMGLQLQQFTLELWIYPFRPQRWATLVTKTATWGDGWGLITLDDAKTLTFFTTSWQIHDAKGTSVNCPMPCSGHWTHIAVTCDGRQLRMYQNGHLCSTAEQPERIQYDTRGMAPIVVGGTQWSGKVHGFHGVVSDLRVWSHARSAGDIQKLQRQEPRPRQSGLLCRYRFDPRDSYRGGRDDGIMHCHGTYWGDARGVDLLPATTMLETGDNLQETRARHEV
eukprot:Clim_evm63s25 gene=Clim_evmTU63s25